METLLQSSPSVFAQMVDKLRTKSEEELKLLYLNLFSAELNEEWRNVTSGSDLAAATDEEIIEAIKKNRYKG